MHPKILKIGSSFVLLMAAAAFAGEGLGFDTLDNFAVITQYDAWGWTVLLVLLAASQAVMQRFHHCTKCRLWSDFLLQVSGLVLLIIGMAFVAEYPPFSWFMGVFPIVGVLFVLIGRTLSRKSREKLGE